MQIEKGVPIPINKRRPYEEGWARLWKQMVPGDSVFVPNEDSQGPTMRSASKWSMRGEGKLKNARFMSSREGTGLRIWRIV